MIKNAIDFIAYLMVMLAIIFAAYVWYIATGGEYDERYVVYETNSNLNTENHEQIRIDQ